MCERLGGAVVRNHQRGIAKRDDNLLTLRVGGLAPDRRGFEPFIFA